MSRRKWEDLEVDCLVNVLRRVGMESLLLDVPFVCKSWYKASLNPLCWERLVFPINSRDYDALVSRFMVEYRIESFPVDAFIKFIVDRSQKNSTVLILPDECSGEVLKYTANECPGLRVLSLTDEVLLDQSAIIPELIGKWKYLEYLALGSSYKLKEITANISLDCKNFVGLRVSRANIGKEEASAFVTNLPKIKHLILRGAFIEEENLMMILQGCKDLVHLDVSNCIGFEPNNKILELASHIHTFKYRGSRLEDYFDYEPITYADACLDDDYTSD